MKPRVKNDSWCYTASTKQARQKIKRLTRKRHRDSDRRLVKEESKESLIKCAGVSGGPAISRKPPRYEACESLRFFIRTAQRSSGLCPPEL